MIVETWTQLSFTSISSIPVVLKVATLNALAKAISTNLIDSSILPSPSKLLKLIPFFSECYIEYETSITYLVIGVIFTEN